MKRFGMILSASAFVVVLASCKNEADPQADKTFFTKFYDNSQFNLSYTPLDVVQASDGGYIVLALKREIHADGEDVEPGSIYLMKTDEFGTFVSEELSIPDNLVLPAPALIDINKRFFFFCSDLSDSFSGKLVEVDNNGKFVKQINITGGTNPTTYPLAAEVDGNNLMLLNYDVANRQTVMSVVDIDGKVTQNGQKTKAFTIGAGDDGPEKPVLESILGTGRRLPFQVGKTASGLYFFNGVYNYTMSIVFTDLAADKPLGTVQGNQDDGGISALLPISGNKFAAARFSFGDNYILPQTTLTVGANPTAVSLGGNAFPELTPYAPVTIISATIHESPRVIYGSNTRGKQIALYGYNSADGTFVGSKYIGFSNTFEIASVAPTADDGLVVLGTTYIAGRFSRICLFKLSAESLGQSFQ